MRIVSILIITFLFCFSLGIISSCSQDQSSSTVSRSSENANIDDGTLAGDILRDLSLYLTGSGLTEVQANVIIQSANEQVNLGLSTTRSSLYKRFVSLFRTVDRNNLNTILPLMVEGALLALANENIGEITDDDKLSITQIILEGSFDVLDGRVVDLSAIEQKSLISEISISAMASLNETGTDSAHLIPMTSIVTLQCLSNFSLFTIENNEISSTIQNIVSNIIYYLDDAGLQPEQFPTVIDSVGEMSVLSLNSQGIPSDKKIESLEKIANGLITALGNTSLSEDLLTESVGNITQGMVFGLQDNSGFESYELGSAIESIMKGTISGMSDLTIDQEHTNSTLNLLSLNVISTLNNSGASNEMISALVKSITQGAISAIDEGGFSVDLSTTENFIEKIVGGTINGLDSIGLPVGMIDNATATLAVGAYLGLQESNIDPESWEYFKNIINDEANSAINSIDFTNDEKINITNALSSAMNNPTAYYDPYEEELTGDMDDLIDKIEAPDNITITPGIEQNTLSWDNVTNALYYNLYVSNVSDVSIFDQVTTGVISPYVHTSLDSGNTYYYLVVAVDENGNLGEIPSAVSGVPLAQEDDDDDEIGPTAITLTANPISGSTILDSSSIVITFSQSMDTSSVTVSGTASADIQKSWSQTTTSNDTLTISNISTLGASRTFIISGNGSTSGVLSTTTLTYTILDSNITLLVAPTSGSTITDDSSVVITFSQSMNTASVVVTGTASTGILKTWGQTSTSNDTLTISNITTIGAGLTLVINGSSTSSAVISETTLTYTIVDSTITLVANPVTGSTLTSYSSLVLTFSQSMDTSSVSVLGTAIDPDEIDLAWSQTVYVNDTLTVSGFNVQGSGKAVIVNGEGISGAELSSTTLTYTLYGIGIYVSSVIGNDNNLGTMSSPKATISSAISLAASLALTDVFVAQGIYQDSGVVANLTSGIRLFGGYDHNNWYNPQDFTPGVTVLRNIGNSAGTVNSPTATITMSNFTSIDGVTVEGASSGNYTSGISMPGTVNGIIIMRSTIDGGGGSVNSYGIFAPDLLSSGESTVTFIDSNSINGGDGVQKRYGLYSNYANGTLNSNLITIDDGATTESTGIHINSISTIEITGNTITSGNGVSSFGINAKNNFAGIINGNIIHGGSGNSSTGIFAEITNTGNDDYTIIGNIIYGGTGLNTIGLHLYSGTSGREPHVKNNRIHGGTGQSSSTGIYVQWINAWIYNNFVFGGNAPTTKGINSFTHAATYDFNISNNTINGGTATVLSSAIVGSGAYTKNNIIFNSSDGTGDKYCLDYWSEDGTLYVTNNVFKGCVDGIVIQRYPGVGSELIYSYNATGMEKLAGNDHRPCCNNNYIDSTDSVQLTNTDDPNSDWSNVTDYSLLNSSSVLIKSGGIDGVGQDLPYVDDIYETPRTGNGSSGWSIGAHELD